jgi:hypothetical protein
MDEKPFLEFDINDIKDTQIEEVKKFHKSYFDLTSILSSASDLKYTNEIKAILNNELKNPSEEFVKFFAQKVYPKKVTTTVLVQFAELLKKSIHHVFSDMITDRLKSAIDKEDTFNVVAEIKPDVSVSAESGKEKNIETTPQEMEAFFIVKSILRTVIEPNRITYRDSQTYFAIMVDDNNRKTICRLYLNSNKKFFSTFDITKKETKIEIKNLDEIYNFSEQLKSTIESYLFLKS